MPAAREGRIAGRLMSISLRYRMSYVLLLWGGWLGWEGSAAHPGAEGGEEVEGERWEVGSSKVRRPGPWAETDARDRERERGFQVEHPSFSGSRLLQRV